MTGAACNPILLLTVKIMFIFRVVSKRKLSPQHYMSLELLKTPISLPVTAILSLWNSLVLFCGKDQFQTFFFFFLHIWFFNTVPFQTISGKIWQAILISVATFWTLFSLSLLLIQIFRLQNRVFFSPRVRSFCCEA